MSDQLTLLPQAPRVYANGLGVGYSKTECMVTFMFSDDPVVSVILPFSVAKGLSENLAVMVAEFQKRSGIAIPAMSEITVEEGTVPAVSK